MQRFAVFPGLLKVLLEYLFIYYFKEQGHTVKK